jgi:methylglyoxal synthase
MRTIIVMAHQATNKRLVKLLIKHREVFREYRLLSTAETGEIVERETGLEVTHLFPARKGGDIQLCGLVCTGTIAAVIFLRDPLSNDPAEPDIAPFLRACDLNSVPLATNVVTAHALATWLGRKAAIDGAAPANVEEGTGRNTLQ